MRTRPLLAASTALALIAGAAPVLAAIGDVADGPLEGTASSSVTLLDVALGARQLRVLGVELGSASSGGTPSSSVVVTPLSVDGTAYGRQSLDRTADLPPVDTSVLASSLVDAVASVRSPLVGVTRDGAMTRAGTTELGAVSVLGLPLSLGGTIAMGSDVESAGSLGDKTLTVTDLALPSVADLVSALGLDLTKLPTGTLADLLGGLSLDTVLTNDALATLTAALDDLGAQLPLAQDALTGAGSAVETAAAAVTAAEQALAPLAEDLLEVTAGLDLLQGLSTTPPALLRAQLFGLPIPLPSVPSVPLVDEVLAPVVVAVDPVVAPVLDAVVEPVVNPVLDVVEPVLDDIEPAVLPVELPLELATLYAQTWALYEAAVATLTDAELSLAGAVQLLADAQTTVDTLLGAVTAESAAFVGATLGVLDSTPLLSLDRLEVTTRSRVTSATAGGQTAEIVGGVVEGLSVLGTDVLDTVLGESSVEATALLGGVGDQLDAAVLGLTGTLASTLSSVPGLPGLEVPAPRIALLSAATTTSITDGFGLAGSALRALTVTLPGLSIPAAVAVPGAATLPGVSGLLSAAPLSGLQAGLLGVGDVLSQPLSLSVATLEDFARFRPAQLAALPTLPVPTLPLPGLPVPTAPLPTAAPALSPPAVELPAGVVPGLPVPGAVPVSEGAAVPVPGAQVPGTGPSAPVTTGAPADPRTTPVALVELPRTGASGGAAALALLLVGIAVSLRRRSAVQP